MAWLCLNGWQSSSLFRSKIWLHSYIPLHSRTPLHRIHSTSNNTAWPTGILIWLQICTVLYSEQFQHFCHIIFCAFVKKICAVGMSSCAFVKHSRKCCGHSIESPHIYGEICKIITKCPPYRLFYSLLYRKIPKNSDTRKIAVLILKFEQCGSTIE